MLRNRLNQVILPVFLVFALLQGLFFMHAFGALSIPDADVHANSSYALSSGQIFNLPKSTTDTYGNPVKQQEITGDSRILSHKGLNNNLIVTLLTGLRYEITYIDDHKALQQSTDTDRKRIITVPQKNIQNRSNQYFPLIFLPQAIGVWLGLHTNATPYTCWQMGRISNFIVFLLLFSLAIALIPKGKTFLAIIGCIPPTIFIASSLMADALFISVSALFIALVFKYAEENIPLNGSKIVSLVVLTALLFFSKFVYAAQALLVLALPGTVLTIKRKAQYTCYSLLYAVPIYALWNYFYGGTWANTNIHNNMHFIMHEPASITVQILRNIRLLRQDLLQLPPLFMTITKVLFILTFVFAGISWFLWMRSHSNKYSYAPSNVRRKTGFSLGLLRYPFVAILVVLIVLALTYISLLMTWNTLPQTTANTRIAGFQGRYLMPLLPLLLSVGYIAKRPEDIENTDIVGPQHRAAPDEGTQSSIRTKHSDNPNNSSRRAGECRQCLIMPKTKH